MIGIPIYIKQGRPADIKLFRPRVFHILIDNQIRGGRPKPPGGNLLRREIKPPPQFYNKAAGRQIVKQIRLLLGGEIHGFHKVPGLDMSSFFQLNPCKKPDFHRTQHRDFSCHIFYYTRHFDEYKKKYSSRLEFLEQSRADEKPGGSAPGQGGNRGSAPGGGRGGAPRAAVKTSYSLLFVNFPLFRDSEEVVNSFSIRSDKPPHFILTSHFGMVFVDLSRFCLPEGGPEGLVDLASAWCYFISGSADLSDRGRAALFRINEVFKVADAILKDLSVKGEVRVLEKLREKWLRDQASKIDYSYIEEKFRQEGLRKGRQEGRQERDLEVISNMLQAKADISFISKVTGLSEAEIIKFKNSGLKKGKAD